MAPWFGAALNDGCGGGWQSDWLGSLDGPFLLGCACTSLLDWVAHTFYDFDTFSGLF